MPQEKEAVRQIEDARTGRDIFVSVEMSRSRWVVGFYTRLRAFGCTDASSRSASVSW